MHALRNIAMYTGFMSNPKISV